MNDSVAFCADLSDLSKLADHVRNSDVLVLVQSLNVCSRPWCIMELVTAIESGVPIICLNLTSGVAAYDFAAASSLLRHLDTQLEEEKRAQLEALGVDLTDAAFKLSTTLEQVISVPLNMAASQNMLEASIKDIVEAIVTATPRKLPDRDK